MRIKVIKEATEKRVNEYCAELEKSGFEIMDIIYTHPSYNHYVEYAVIKYIQGHK